MRMPSLCALDYTTETAVCAKVRRNKRSNDKKRELVQKPPSLKVDHVGLYLANIKAQ